MTAPVVTLLPRRRTKRPTGRTVPLAVICYRTAGHKAKLGGPAKHGRGEVTHICGRRDWIGRVIAVVAPVIADIIRSDDVSRDYAHGVGRATPRPPKAVRLGRHEGRGPCESQDRGRCKGGLSHHSIGRPFRLPHSLFECGG